MKKDDRQVIKVKPEQHAWLKESKAGFTLESFVEAILSDVIAKGITFDETGKVKVRG